MGFDPLPKRRPGDFPWLPPVDLLASRARGASRKSLLAVGAAASIGLIGAVALTHRGAQSDINQPHAELINPQVENIPSLDMMDKWHYMVLPPGD